MSSSALEPVEEIRRAGRFEKRVCGLMTAVIHRHLHNWPCEPRRCLGLDDSTGIYLQIVDLMFVDFRCSPTCNDLLFAGRRRRRFFRWSRGCCCLRCASRRRIPSGNLLHSALEQGAADLLATWR